MKKNGWWWERIHFTFSPRIDPPPSLSFFSLSLLFLSLFLYSFSLFLSFSTLSFSSSSTHSFLPPLLEFLPPLFIHPPFFLVLIWLPTVCFLSLSLSLSVWKCWERERKWRGREKESSALTLFPCLSNERVEHLKILNQEEGRKNVRRREKVREREKGLRMKSVKREWKGWASEKEGWKKGRGEKLCLEKEERERKGYVFLIWKGMDDILNFFPSLSFSSSFLSLPLSFCEKDGKNFWERKIFKLWKLFYFFLTEREREEREGERNERMNGRTVA